MFEQKACLEMIGIRMRYIINVKILHDVCISFVHAIYINYVRQNIAFDESLVKILKMNELK